MDNIKTFEKTNCSICGSEGNFLYKSLTDKYFNAPGNWSLFKCSNNSCNQLWLNPMPLEEEISVAYKNYYTHSNNIENHVVSKIKEKYKKLQLGFISKKFGYKKVEHSFWQNLLYLDPDRLEQTKYEVMYLKSCGGKLLDIGCGNGNFIEFMNGFGWETMGIDFDEKAVKSASLKKLNVKLGNLIEQNFPDNYFDAITVAHVIEHLYHPKELLQECKRILKSGGQLVISTPNSQSIGHLIFKETWRGLEVPRHIQVFCTQSLVQLLKSSGFNNFTSFTSNRIARYIYNFSGKLRQSNLSENKVNRITRIGARFFSLFEWILIKMKINCGEEVIAIIEKK